MARPRLAGFQGPTEGLTHGRVTAVRNNHGIPVFDPAADRQKLPSLEETATRLGLTKPALRRLVKRGLLSATQPVRYAPWSIRADDLDAEAVRCAVDAVRRGQPLPRTAPANQLTFDNSTT